MKTARRNPYSASLNRNQVLPMVLMTLWTLILGLHCVSSDPGEIHAVEHFVTAALDGRVNSRDLWLINVGANHEEEFSAEMLFLVDPKSPTNQLCMRGCRLPSDASEDQQCPDDMNSVKAVGIIGYFRPGIVKRFCLWEDGIIDSYMTRKWLRVATVSLAPSLKDLTALIDEQGPERTCVPPAHRGILYETMELLCFAMGHKPAVIRQRQIHNPGANGHSSLGLLSGVPANLFVPHTRVMIAWLLAQRDQVWRSASKVEWDTDPPSHDPPFEHAIVMAHDANLGQHLVELHVQDASVPHQPDIVATSNYIAHVGAALGYSQEQVRIYLETSGVIPTHDISPEEVQVMFDTSLSLAYDNLSACEDNDNSDNQNQQCQQKQQFPELAGFRSFLESEEATFLSTAIFHQVVESLDVLFLL